MLVSQPDRQKRGFGGILPFFRRSGIVSITSEEMVFSGYLHRYDKAGCGLIVVMSLAMTVALFGMEALAEAGELSLREVRGGFYAIGICGTLGWAWLQLRVKPVEYRFRLGEVSEVFRNGTQIRLRTPRRDGKTGLWEWHLVPDDLPGLIAALRAALPEDAYRSTWRSVDRLS